MRRSVITIVAIVAACLSAPALAASGSSQPKPCAVTYEALPQGDGQPITTTFAVECAADGQWEITSIDQRTTLQDLTARGATRQCRQQVPSTAARQTCALTGVKLHAYLVTYRFIASGNYAVCLDDGTCDANTPVEEPACQRTALDQLVAANTESVVLDCTYRQLVTVPAT